MKTMRIVRSRRLLGATHRATGGAVGLADTRLRQDSVRLLEHLSDERQIRGARHGDARREALGGERAASALESGAYAIARGVPGQAEEGKVVGFEHLRQLGL